MIGNPAIAITENDHTLIVHAILLQADRLPKTILS
jgi:hypothetical protein